ncbi:MAG: helix-turn-helix transcriptional regulator, partial [Acidimicrobiia bacterium]
GLARVGTPALRTRLGLELLTLSGLSGDLEGVVHAARSIGDDADDDTRLLAAATRLFGEGLTLSLQDPEGTYRLARTLVEAGAGDALLIDRLEMSRALTDLADGRLLDARHRFAGDRTALGPWLTVEALLADAWAPVVEAESVAAEAVAALEAFDPLGNLPQARGLLALRRAQQGVASDPVPPPESEPGVAAIQAIMDDRADAWLSRSPAALVDVGRRAVAMGHRLWGLCCFIDAVRLGARDEVAADVEQFAVAGGVGLARVAAIHARAATVDDHWAAARAWWAAGATSYGAEAALAGAVSDRDRAGLQLLATSAAPTVGDWPPTGPWTDRQVGVVRRVLDGATNQAIADELFISRRTVENHLHAAYSAAGLEGRDDLRDRFGWIAEPESEPTAGTAANRPGRPTMSTPTSANE